MEVKNHSLLFEGTQAHSVVYSETVQDFTHRLKLIYWTNRCIKGCKLYTPTHLISKIRFQEDSQ